NRGGDPGGRRAHDEGRGEDGPTGPVSRAGPSASVVSALRSSGQLRTPRRGGTARCMVRLHVSPSDNRTQVRPTARPARRDASPRQRRLRDAFPCATGVSIRLGRTYCSFEYRRPQTAHPKHKAAKYTAVTHLAAGHALCRPLATLQPAVVRADDPSLPGRVNTGAMGSAATAAHGHEEGDRREHHEHEYDGGYRPPRQGRGGDLVREDRGRGDRVVLTGGVVLPGLEYVPGDGVAGTAGEDRRAHEHGPVELLVEQGRHVTCVGVDRRGLLGVHHHQVHSVVIGVLDDLADTFHI